MWDSTNFGLSLDAVDNCKPEISDSLILPTFFQKIAGLIVMSWWMSFFMYGIIVFGTDSYFFNHEGLRVSVKKPHTYTHNPRELTY